MVLLPAAVVVVAFLAARLTRPEDSQLSLVAPTAAIGALWLGAVWRGRHFLPSLFALPTAVVVATLVSGEASVPLAVVFAAANLAQALVACWLANRWSRSPPEDSAQDPVLLRLRTTTDLGRLVLVAGVSSTAAALLITGGLWSLDIQHTSLATVLQLVVRNSVSVIVLASVVLLLLDRSAGYTVPLSIKAGAPERTAMVLAVLLGYALAFWWNHGLPVAFAVLPLSAWYALRRPTLTTAFHLLLVMVAVVVTTVLGRGPFAGFPVATTVLMAQSFIGLVNVSSLLTALSRDERHRLLEQAEQARVEAANQSLLLNSVFASVSDGISVFDRHGDTLLRNAAAEALLGPAITAASPWFWTERLGFFQADGSPFPHEELPIVRALRGEDVPGVDVLLRSEHHPDGLVLNISAHPLATGRGVRWSGGVVAAYHDVTAVRARADRLARTRDVLARQVAHDALTGLPNRTLFRQRLEEALALAPTTGSQVGVLYLDLDGFKAVNDTGGHDAGDELLREVGALLHRCVRPGDTVARLGGDEFALVCPTDSGVEDLVAIAERILALLREPLVLRHGTFTVGASIGVRLAGSGESGDQLLREADQAMYASKRAGKNRVTVHEAVAEHRTAS